MSTEPLMTNTNTQGEWVWVPRVETDEQCEAGLEALRENLGHSSVIARDAAACYRAMLSATPSPEIEQGWTVKPLEWVRPTGAVASETMRRAETIIGTYRVWSHAEANGAWFWQVSDGATRANGSGTEQQCFRDAQADFARRISSSIVPSAVVVSDEAVRKFCGDAVNGGLIRDMAYTVWSLCHNSTHDDGNADWFNDTLPIVNKAVEELRAALLAASSIVPAKDGETWQGIADASEIKDIVLGGWYAAPTIWMRQPVYQDASGQWRTSWDSEAVYPTHFSRMAPAPGRATDPALPTPPTEARKS